MHEAVTESTAYVSASFTAVAVCSYVMRDQHSLVYLPPPLRVSYLSQPSALKHEEEQGSTLVK